MVNNAIPSTTEKLPLIEKTTNNNKSTNNTEHLDANPTRLKLVGLKEKAIPKISAKLHIIEPSTFPVAKANSPFLTAINEIQVSGKVVAKLTIVDPTIIGEIFNLFDIKIADSTNISPPLKITITDKKNKINMKKVSIFNKYSN